MPARHDEAIDLLFEKILEDEDKIIQAEIRRQKRERKNSSSSSCSQEEGDIGSSDFSIDSDLQTFNQDEEVEEPLEPFLNESTADFNKEIREARQELIKEGKLDPISGMVVSDREDNFDVQIKIPVKMLQNAEVH